MSLGDSALQVSRPYREARQYPLSLLQRSSVLVYVPSLHGGGAERVAVNLANAMAEMGVAVTLVVATDKGRYWELVSKEVKLIRCRAKLAVLSVFTLLRVVRKERPAVMLSTLKATNTVLAMLKPLLLRKTRVAIREASIYQQPRQLVDFIYEVLRRCFFRYADIFIANSRATLLSFQEAEIALPKRVAVLRNPVYEPRILRLANEQVDHRWIREKSGYLIVGIGRLVRYKGFDLLLEAIQLLKRRGIEVRCIILGEGAERNTLQQQAKELGVDGQVDLVGFKANPYAFLAHADVFVLPSRWEGFGNVIVEALALDVPVVAARCPGGAEEILENGKWGSLVTPEDPLALADGIEDTLVKPPRKELHKRAREYDVVAVTRQYLEVLLSDT